MWLPLPLPLLTMTLPPQLFSRDTGNIVWSRFNGRYNSKCVLQNVDPIPFRLTRNLQFFLTSVGVEGSFVGTISAVVSALSKYIQKILPCRCCE